MAPPPHRTPFPATLPAARPGLVVRLRAARRCRQWVRRERWFHWFGGDEGLPGTMSFTQARAVALRAFDTQLRRSRDQLGAALWWAVGARHPGPADRACRTLLCGHRRQVAVERAAGLVPAAALVDPAVGPLLDPLVDRLDPLAATLARRLAPSFPGTFAELVAASTVATAA